METSELSPPHVNHPLPQLMFRTTVFPNNISMSPSRRPARCAKIDYDYTVIPAVICSMCFLFGIVYTFFGYRFFKAVMFLTGFIFGTVVVYIVCIEETVLPKEANIGIAVGAGIICGLITMLVQYVGLFLTGFHFGVGLSTGVLVTVDQFYNIANKWIPIGVLIGVGILFALLTLKFQKAGTIVGTSVFGAALMAICLDYFIEKFLIVNYVWECIKVEDSDPPCWYSWLILGCWPFCFLVGSLTQWRITGQSSDHHERVHRNNVSSAKYRSPSSDEVDVLQNKRSRKVNLQRIRAKQKREQQQSRYRHLYQVRRFNGDVISQNYIQSIQHKLSPAMRSLTTIHCEPVVDLESANTTLTQVS
ncbi:transmembrane protein 198 isoform X2 [Octopus bimaculoides]|uniref:Transmembrane protein 198 n=1 Tax=Octopus bimaculoides TaxID=37653 RepID=A0A0L8FX70_OCTBM|nr:transmembrane protein 198 isoform X2 [Octopus bimaculoides]|eukprot:XP_014786161.1 PREDICTED: transmembrane protein 198-like isoform X2 [Octopus bimaculoides]